MMEEQQEEYTHASYDKFRLKELAKPKTFYDSAQSQYHITEDPQATIRPMLNKILTYKPSTRLLELACPKWPYFCYYGTKPFRFIRRDHTCIPKRRTFGFENILGFMPTLKQIETTRPTAVTFLPFHDLETKKTKKPRLVMFPLLPQNTKNICSNRIKILAQPRQNNMKNRRREIEKAEKIYTVCKEALNAFPSPRIIELAKPKEEVNMKNRRWDATIMEGGEKDKQICQRGRNKEATELLLNNLMFSDQQIQKFVEKTGKICSVSKKLLKEAKYIANKKIDRSMSSKQLQRKTEITLSKDTQKKEDKLNGIGLRSLLLSPSKRKVIGTDHKEIHGKKKKMVYVTKAEGKIRLEEKLDKTDALNQTKCQEDAEMKERNVTKEGIISDQTPEKFISLPNENMREKQNDIHLEAKLNNREAIVKYINDKERTGFKYRSSKHEDTWGEIKESKCLAPEDIMSDVTLEKDFGFEKFAILPATENDMSKGEIFEQIKVAIMQPVNIKDIEITNRYVAEDSSLSSNVNIHIPDGIRVNGELHCKSIDEGISNYIKDEKVKDQCIIQNMPPSFRAEKDSVLDDKTTKTEEARTEMTSSNGEYNKTEPETKEQITHSKGKGLSEEIYFSALQLGQMKKQKHEEREKQPDGMSIMSEKKEQAKTQPTEKTMIQDSELPLITKALTETLPVQELVVPAIAIQTQKMIRSRNKQDKTMGKSKLTGNIIFQESELPSITEALRESLPVQELAAPLLATQTQQMLRNRKKREEVKKLIKKTKSEKRHRRNAQPDSISIMSAMKERPKSRLTETAIFQESGLRSISEALTESLPVQELATPSIAIETQKFIRSRKNQKKIMRKSQPTEKNIFEDSELPFVTGALIESLRVQEIAAPSIAIQTQQMIISRKEQEKATTKSQLTEKTIFEESELPLVTEALIESLPVQQLATPSIAIETQQMVRSRKKQKKMTRRRQLIASTRFPESQLRITEGLIDSLPVQELATPSIAVQTQQMIRSRKEREKTTRKSQLTKNIILQESELPSVTEALIENLPVQELATPSIAIQTQQMIRSRKEREKVTKSQPTEKTIFGESDLPSVTEALIESLPVQELAAPSIAIQTQEMIRDRKKQQKVTKSQPIEKTIFGESELPSVTEALIESLPVQELAAPSIAIQTQEMIRDRKKQQKVTKSQPIEKTIFGESELPSVTEVLIESLPVQELAVPSIAIQTQQMIRSRKEREKATRKSQLTKNIILQESQLPAVTEALIESLPVQELATPSIAIETQKMIRSKKNRKKMTRGRQSVAKTIFGESELFSVTKALIESMPVQELAAPSIAIQTQQMIRDRKKQQKVTKSQPTQKTIFGEFELPSVTEALIESLPVQELATPSIAIETQKMIRSKKNRNEMTRGRQPVAKTIFGESQLPSVTEALIESMPVQELAAPSIAIQTQQMIRDRKKQQKVTKSQPTQKTIFGESELPSVTEALIESLPVQELAAPSIAIRTQQMIRSRKEREKATRKSQLTKNIILQESELPAVTEALIESLPVQELATPSIAIETQKMIRSKKNRKKMTRGRQSVAKIIFGESELPSVTEALIESLPVQELAAPSIAIQTQQMISNRKKQPAVTKSQPTEKTIFGESELPLVTEALMESLPVQELATPSIAIETQKMIRSNKKRKKMTRVRQPVAKTRFRESELQITEALIESLPVQELATPAIAIQTQQMIRSREKLEKMMKSQPTEKAIFLESELPLVRTREKKEKMMRLVKKPKPEKRYRQKDQLIQTQQMIECRRKRKVKKLVENLSSEQERPKQQRTSSGAMSEVLKAWSEIHPTEKTMFQEAELLLTAEALAETLPVQEIAVPTIAIQTQEMIIDGRKRKKIKKLMKKPESEKRDRRKVQGDNVSIMPEDLNERIESQPTEKTIFQESELPSITEALTEILPVQEIAVPSIAVQTQQMIRNEQTRKKITKLFKKPKSDKRSSEKLIKSTARSSTTQQTNMVVMPSDTITVGKQKAKDVSRSIITIYTKRKIRGRKLSYVTPPPPRKLRTRSMFLISTAEESET